MLGLVKLPTDITGCMIVYADTVSFKPVESWEVTAAGCSVKETEPAETEQLITRNKSNHYISPSQKESRKTTARIQGHQPYRCIELQFWLENLERYGAWQIIPWQVEVHCICICQVIQARSVPLNMGISPVSELLAKSSQYKSGIPPSDGGIEPWNLLFKTCRHRI